ncbi:MAG: S8 family serine peptidase [Alteromonadaceae bacterium]
MRNKVAVAVSTALITVSLSSVASVDIASKTLTFEANPALKSITNSKLANNTYSTKFVAEKNLAAGVYTYIVRLKDMPLATYDGSIAGLAATNPNIAKKELFAKLAKSKMTSQQIRNELRLDTKSTDSVQYTNFLESKQADFLTQAKSKLGKNAQVVYQYKNAFNGLALNLTQDEAAKLSSLNSVAFVERERMEQMDTDTGPIHIGATQVWEGEGPTAVNMGEGVIIGVIDSGVNSDHDSFADVGGDGYDHTNPWGAGVYVGDCAGDFASMCNDKLIGVRSYASVTDNYDDVAVYGDTPPAKNGEDYGGHGSHTASTAGGNILKNVSLVDPEFGEAESDGINSTGFEFEQISGVAPHANIVAYQICNSGDSGDTYSGCPGAAIIAALDDAVADGVDILNYSISGGGDPWTSSTELGFLAAQQAGIFAAVSAGNSGPGAYTTPKSAPWYTAVGASTHGRTVAFDKELNGFTGGDTELAALEGSSASEGITAKIVWAGDYTNSNDVSGDPAQCLEPFPEGTFDGEIVVCDRGAIARTQKAINVADGGAGGYVLGNIDGGAESVANDVYIIPGIHMNAENGNSLRTWLASGIDHMATITAAAGELVIGQADDMAGFSSRGPNLYVDNIMSPSVTAPGVSIYAAYSDQQFGHDVTGTAPADFAFLQGTSMSSPHTAGAGAVLKSAHPTWTPDNIRSALMLTATTDVRKEDGETPADVFDMGSGSIRVNLATNTGLVMDETFANYMKANPSVSGKPETLNIPSMANTKCIDTCSWTRTFTATADASWAVTTNSPATGTEETPIPSTMELTVTPSSFDILAGETQTITVTADVSASAANVWNFGDVTLTSAGMPDARLPLLVQVGGNNLPTSASIVANRADGSITYTGLKSEDLSGTVTAVAYESNVIEEVTLGVPDGSYGLHEVTFTETVPQVVFTTSSDEAPDADLVIYDASFSVIGVSQGSDTNELVSFTDLAAGTYYAAIWAYTPSAPGATDAVNLQISTTNFNEDSISEVVTTSLMQNANDFDLTLTWTGARNNAGLVELKDADSNFVIPWSISLGKSDVVEVIADELVNGLQTMEPGVAQPVAFEIAPNFTNSDKVYTLVAEVTEGQEISNVNNDGVVDGNLVTWMITRAVGESIDMLSVGFDLIPRTSSTGNEVVLSNTLGSDTVMSTYSFGVVEVSPVAVITSTNTANERAKITVNGGESFDDNHDELTYTWTQLAGTPVTFISTAESISFSAPKISKDEKISFNLMVDDGNGNQHSTVTSITIINKESGGGSSSWLLLLLTPMLFTRRRKM